MSDTGALIRLIAKDFDIAENLSEEQLYHILVNSFDYLVENDFSKLLQILYRADVDQYKLKELLENSENQNSAEVIAKAYVERQKAKIETWKKYSS